MLAMMESSAVEIGVENSAAESGVENSAAENGVENSAAETGVENSAAEIGVENSSVEKLKSIFLVFSWYFPGIFPVFVFPLGKSTGIRQYC